MSDYYADSSVLVKRHVAEPGSAWFRSLVAPGAANVIVSSRLSMAEVYSALNRRRREALLTVQDYADISAEFTRVALSQYTILELTPTIVEQARRLLERHPLRAPDAIQLASGLSAATALRAAGLAPLTFLAADADLLVAAQAEGLVVDHPNVRG